MNHERRHPAIHPIGLLTALLLCPSLPLLAQDPVANKALARQFYEQVWFTPHLEAIDDLVAPTYVLHDIGTLKGIQEPASAQKAIAGFFWDHGSMTGQIDYQLAEGDMVATRWQWQYEPRDWWMKLVMLGGRRSVPVINVFRFENGKIVEIWNHRHDIDIGFRTNVLLAKGFLAGLLLPAAGLLLMALRRRLRRAPTVQPGRA